jgi:hypothetical protein
MARTAVAVVALTGADIADPAGTTADATNDHIVSGVALEEVLLRVSKTSAAGASFTVLAGANPPALSAGQGNLVSTSMGDGSVTPVVRWAGPFESARFAQADGSLHVDLPTGFTGTVTAFRVGRV